MVTEAEALAAIRQALADYDKSVLKPWDRTLDRIRAAVAQVDDPDSWYAAEVKRMAERAPA